MLSLYFVHYNFCRQHKSLNKLSHTMAAGVSNTLHDMEWICGLINAHTPKPGPRGPYKKGEAANSASDTTDCPRRLTSPRNICGD